ncbi:hypothetical protein [Oceanobacillus sp. CAU 1775]
MKKMIYTMIDKIKQVDVWLVNGLFKDSHQAKQPSVVRTSKIISVHCSELKRQLGTLHNHDLERVLHMCRSLF